MTAGSRRAALIRAEAAFIDQRLDGLDMRHCPPAATSHRLLYNLQSGAETRIPPRLVRAALGIPVIDLAAGYVITVDDELVPLDSQGTPRADLPLRRMTRYATPGDVDTERTDTDPAWSDERVDALLDAAHDLASLGRDLPARIAAGRTTPGLVRHVVLEVVLAVLRNSAGLRSYSSTEAAGPFTAVTAATMSHDGRLRLTREQRRLLGDRISGIRTIAPG